MSGPQTVASTQGKLFVVDYSNNRVTGYNSIPMQTGAAADFVIGQDDFGESDCDTAANRLCNPSSIAAVNGKLLIADSENNRVLIYNTIPTVNGAPADLVLGQADMVSGAANRGGAPAADTLNYPAGVWSDGRRVAVWDNKNNRVLIWNSFPTSNGQPADLVLGQSDFTHTQENDDDQDGADDGKPSARTFGNAQYNTGIYSKGTQLFVTDAANNRVLVWDTFPTQNFTPADRVLGQCAFDTDTANGPDAGVSARGLDFPMGITVDNQNRVIVTDQNNGRVLIYQ